jgi:FeS assembly protein IscX
MPSATKAALRKQDLIDFIPDSAGARPHSRLALAAHPATTPAMKLTWSDHEEIAWALADKYPGQDPLRLSFPKLHQMICELEDFADDPAGSNERVLETIQMAWCAETK